MPFIYYVCNIKQLLCVKGIVWSLGRKPNCNIDHPFFQITQEYADLENTVVSQSGTETTTTTTTTTVIASTTTVVVVVDVVVTVDLYI